MLKLFFKVKKKLKEKGFTLVELIAVIVIIAILLLIAIPGVLNVVQVSKRKTFVSYVDKMGTLATEKRFKDALDGKSSENGCFIYNLKTDFDLSNVGTFQGYVLVNSTGEKPTYYITLWNEDYMLIAYNYTDGINFNNKKISINDSIELFDSLKSNELKPEYLCGFGCENCIVNSDEITPSEVHVPIDHNGEDEPVVTPKTQTTLVNGLTFNDIVSKLAGDSNCTSSSSDCKKVKEIKKSDVLKESDTVKNVSNTDDESQKNPVYVWFENGTIYFYSNADNIYLNSDCYKMFHGFKGLTDVDDFLKSVYSDKVTNMGEMFYECSLLKDLDFSNFNTSKVTNFSDLFSYCESLVTLNIASFNTSRVENMDYMFECCQALTTLDLSNFNTKNVTSMYGMFHECINLVDLNITSFDTSNVTSMNSMFCHCESLVTLNITSFNTTKVNDMTEMFYKCKKVETILINEFNISSVTESSDMFSGCKALQNYSSSKIDAAMAKDKNQGGYLTVVS